MTGEKANEYEWQYVGFQCWVYGLKVRGLIRDHLAEVWCDEEGWKWLVHPTDEERESGKHATEFNDFDLKSAVENAEVVLRAKGLLRE